MKLSLNRILPVFAAAALALAGTSARAESNFQTGAAPLTATARLNFKVVIPNVLWLQIGTGALFSTVTTIDAITFTVPTTSLGNGTALAGTGGDQTAGTVTAAVISNGSAGGVNITSSTGGALSDGASHTISWSQISITDVPVGTDFTPPVLTDTGTNSVTIAPTAGVVNASSKWTFKYLNATTPYAGTYTGQVLYTALQV